MSVIDIESQVRPYLDLVDNLRKIGVERDFPITKIAVVGDQSSGKSSVLESISGIPFPRGSGLVTKLATVIQMKKIVGPWSGSIEVILYTFKMVKNTYSIF